MILYFRQRTWLYNKGHIEYFDMPEVFIVQLLKFYFSVSLYSNSSVQISIKVSISNLSENYYFIPIKIVDPLSP